jgi:hypothetical protein
MNFNPLTERLHRLLVKIYQDEDYTQLVGTYVALFGYVPRVGDIITEHDRIENAVNCCVKAVCAIPRDTPESTDVDAVIMAVVFTSDTFDL